MIKMKSKKIQNVKILRLGLKWLRAALERDECAETQRENYYRRWKRLVSLAFQSCLVISYSRQLCGYKLFKHGQNGADFYGFCSLELSWTSRNHYFF